MLHMTVPVTPVYISIVVMRSKIIRKIGESKFMTTRTKSMHERLLKVSFNVFVAACQRFATICSRHSSYLFRPYFFSFSDNFVQALTFQCSLPILYWIAVVSLFRDVYIVFQCFTFTIIFSSNGKFSDFGLRPLNIFEHSSVWSLFRIIITSKSFHLNFSSLTKIRKKAETILRDNYLAMLHTVTTEHRAPSINRIPHDYFDGTDSGTQSTCLAHLRSTVQNSSAQVLFVSHSSISHWGEDRKWYIVTNSSNFRGRHPSLTYIWKYCGVKYIHFPVFPSPLENLSYCHLVWL